ncbi:hypothetical protein [Massilia sp. TSP1-1-2]
MNRKQRIANTSTHCRLMLYLFLWNGMTPHERSTLRLGQFIVKKWQP